MKLDILLPTTLDYTPKGKIILEPEDIESYYENCECFLEILFLSDEKIKLDYACDDFEYLLKDKLKLSNIISIKDIVQFQYELANIFKIDTTDVSLGESINLNFDLPATVKNDNKIYSLRLSFSDDGMYIDYVYDNDISFLDKNDYSEVFTSYDEEDLKENVKIVNEWLEIILF